MESFLYTLRTGAKWTIQSVRHKTELRSCLMKSILFFHCIELKIVEILMTSYSLQLLIKIIFVLNLIDRNKKNIFIESTNKYCGKNMAFNQK